MSHIITVSGNSGKSVFAYFLAVSFSQHKQKVALVSTDGQKPMFRLLFPTKKPAAGHSLGRALSMAVLTQTDIFDNAQVIANDFLMFSYDENDSCLTYPEITSTNLHNFYDQLSQLVDTIIVDTSTSRNDIDQFFMNQSTDICITTADTKGLAYRSFYKPQGVQLALCNSKTYNAMADVMATFTTPVKILPYCEVFNYVYNGTDISDIILPGKYRKIIESLVNEHVAAL